MPLYLHSLLKRLKERRQDVLSLKKFAGLIRYQRHFGKGGVDVKEQITVVKIHTAEELALAHQVRLEVFVQGQGVPLEDEVDRFEYTATHFLASLQRMVCGTARWRPTDQGIKLERFAVLESFRNRGVGAALLEAVLSDITSRNKKPNPSIYLHAQLPAVPFYLKFGFKKVGEMFQECAIDHFKMVLRP